MRNLLSLVRFAEAMQLLVGGTHGATFGLEIESVSDLVEIGPGGALRRPI